MKFSWVWSAHIIKRKIIDKNIVFALVEPPPKLFTHRRPEDVLECKAERREKKRREEERREKERERASRASTMYLGVPAGRVGFVTGHPGFPGGCVVVGSGAYGVPAVVPVAGPVRPTHVTVYDPTPTGVYGIVTGKKPSDHGKRVVIADLGRVRFADSPSSTSRSSGAGHGSSRCGVRSCTISHPQHYCNVCGKWDVTHQDYDCPLYKARRY